MLIASYNPTSTGDTLVLVLAANVKNQKVDIQNNVARIFDPVSSKTTGYNFLKVSEILPEIASQNGRVLLSKAQVSTLNDYLNNNGFKGDIVFDKKPRFIVGYVKTVKDHPRSNHLKVTSTLVDGGKVLQIVSGSPNMKENIKVVVAKAGAFMPNGQIIWPGELRGVQSQGMICSGRELHLPNAPQVPGALILPDDYVVGEPFDFKKAQSIFE